MRYIIIIFFAAIGIWKLTPIATYTTLQTNKATDMISDQHTQEITSQVGKILESYGFTSPKQQNAFIRIMERAGIKLNDLFPMHKDQYDQQKVIEGLINLIQLTQERLMIRTALQERWKVKLLPWMHQVEENNLEETRELFRQLGLVDSILPVNKDPDVICILGALSSTMAKRIEYVQNLVKNEGLKTKKIILVTGERPVTVGEDGSEEQLINILEEYNANHPEHQINNIRQLTETILFEQQYQNSELASYFAKLSIPYSVINTPCTEKSGKRIRPTTQTTLEQLIVEQVLPYPELKTWLFISNQPHVEYQKAIIESAFRIHGLLRKVEVVGGKTINPTIKDLASALGSYIWAASPQIIISMGPIKDPGLQMRLDQLYYSDPLIYQNLKQVFINK